MHHGVESLLRGRRGGTCPVDDASHIQGHIQLLAIEHPGQAAHAGGLRHVQPQRLGTERTQALQPLVVARGGDHAVPVGQVLAHAFEADAA
ncbi:hypothetical protein D9M69_586320 [compost metagenome]